MVDQPLVGEGQCSHSHPTDRLQHTQYERLSAHSGILRA